MNFKLVFLLFLSLIICFSCTKELNSNETTSVDVNLLGIEFTQNLTSTDDQQGTASRAASPSNGNTQKQEINIPVDKDVHLTLEWTTDESTLGKLEKTGQYPSQTTYTRAAGNAASGAISWKLPEGIKFRLLAYDMKGDPVVDTVYTVGQNAQAGLRLNAGQEYTFVAYSILSKTHVPAAPSGKLATALISNVSGDMSFVYFSKKLRLSSGKNQLDVSMKHRFSQINTLIDASAIGVISSLKAHVNNHYMAPAIQLSTGKVSNYMQKTADGKALPFNLSSTGRIAKDSTIICYDGQSASTLVIDEIIINNITKRSISIPDVKLAPGTRYLLSLKINSFTADQAPDIELGNTRYAPGNLIYNRSTDTYAFAEKEEGDYWFKNFVKPRKRDLDSKGWGENNQRPRPELNGGPGDPCAKVLPINSWRLPNREEMDNIRLSTEAQVKGHPGPNIYDPVRYVEGNYRNTGGKGMYFGTQTRPNDNTASKFLFIPFEGIYNDNQHRNDINTTGWYMLKNGGSFEYMQIGPNIYTFSFYTLNENTAVSIRCVKAT